MTIPRSSDELLASQIAYYRAHAPKYDDWWFRRGDHDLGDEFREAWERDIATVHHALEELGHLGEVLEFAGGTGNWTTKLVERADSVTVVDASPEAVAIAREKVTGPVEWVLTDILSFRPDRRYDTVFFSFWLSHVPESRFDAFWQLVADCLAPRGRVFFVDNAHPDHGLRVTSDLFRPGTEDRDSVLGIHSVTDLRTGVSTRTAADGETHELVKIWWEAEELESRLRDLGWDIDVALTDWAFIHGHGTRQTSDR